MATALPTPTWFSFNHIRDERDAYGVVPVWQITPRFVKGADWMTKAPSLDAAIARFHQADSHGMGLSRRFEVAR